jgi:hypothetical protein
MNNAAPNPAIVRARELSHGMIEVADRGDIQGVLELDALRSQLLHGYFDNTRVLSAPDQELLADIARINDSVILKLEALRNGAAGKLDMVGRGRRALAAYSDVQGGGG